ncbi:hypothetical protein AAG906_021194 [Vitis piasezkii]
MDVHQTIGRGKRKAMLCRSVQVEEWNYVERRKQIEQLLSTRQNHQARIQQYHGQDLLQTWGTILFNHLLQTR